MRMKYSLSIIMLQVLLFGCGQMGSLYLPSQVQEYPASVSGDVASIEQQVTKSLSSEMENTSDEDQ
ncbi:MAG: lipoprotein [Gammaproteobacteria bacterium]|nr:lipoprotein [Gammaproteobacteria bacterium]